VFACPPHDDMLFSDTGSPFLVETFRQVYGPRHGGQRCKLHSRKFYHPDSLFRLVDLPFRSIGTKMMQ
jgi:hypothetical protein